MVQCDECCMWRLIYSKYKLKKEEKIKLQTDLDNFTYSLIVDPNWLNFSYQQGLKVLRYGIMCVQWPLQKALLLSKV